MWLVDYKRLLLAILLAVFSLPVAAQVNPYAVNDGEIPDASEYGGPLFQFNYQYPSTIQSPQEQDMPWRKALDGRSLNTKTAYDYVLALKHFVEDPMRILVTQPEKWNQHPPTRWYSML